MSIFETAGLGCLRGWWNWKIFFFFPSCRFRVPKGANFPEIYITSTFHLAWGSSFVLGIGSLRPKGHLFIKGWTLDSTRRSRNRIKAQEISSMPQYFLVSNFQFWNNYRSIRNCKNTTGRGPLYSFPQHRPRWHNYSVLTKLGNWHKHNTVNETTDLTQISADFVHTSFFGMNLCILLPV